VIEITPARNVTATPITKAYMAVTLKVPVMEVTLASVVLSALQEKLAGKLEREK
jgi:hypothetical protein